MNSRSLLPALLLLAGWPVLSQNLSRRPAPSAPAMEFTSTSNASQAGVSLVLGYRFRVRVPVYVTSLGAVLQNDSIRPVFGGLPASMPVALWDEKQNLLVAATVWSGDPVTGHFNYKPVEKTLLLPGIVYTVAGLVAPGRSVLSNVPGMTPGSAVEFGGTRSLASKTLAYPENDAVGVRANYFGASFTYTGAREPVALPGRDRDAVAGTRVKLDGSGSFSEDGSALAWNWALVSKPAGSEAELSASDSASPWFIPDRAGVYVARLTTSAGYSTSEPSTVSIVVRESGRGETSR